MKEKLPNLLEKVVVIKTINSEHFAVWFGLVWFGLVWFGLVWFGLVAFGLV